MKEFRPQVLIGIVVLAVLGWGAMQMGFDGIAGASVAGIVLAVGNLTKTNGTP